MRLFIDMVCYPVHEPDDVDWDTWLQEFELNWCYQVPHWELWSKKGWKFFKEGGYVQL